MKSFANKTDISVLVVDDDDDLRSTAAQYFQKRGYRVAEAASGRQAIELAEQRTFDVAVFDIAMPGMTGIELLDKFVSGGTECEVVMLTGQGTIETAVEAMKMGAHDFVTKPIRMKDLEVVVQKAHEAGQLRKENRQLRAILQRNQTQREMIGNSAAMQEVFRLIDRAGPTDKPILIQGESGTGKELVARALHTSSLVADKPLVVVNCAALPETLLESELFGHEKGAFTGAVGAKQGLFEVADGGTLFIDEIGEMTGSLQAKLLRVLEDGSFRRVGSIKERHVRVRLLAATNRDLEEEVKAGRFREDLYYRINVMNLNLPPLRARIDDIPLLVEHFLTREWTIEPAALQALTRYTWPGNIRQLINALERAKILADDETICLENLPREVAEGSRGAAAVPIDTNSDLESVNRTHVLESLRRENGNKARAARKLGISRRSLYRLLEKFDIEFELGKS